MSPTYTRVTPSLPVTSIPDSIEFYTKVLGFKVAGRDGDNHVWLQTGSHDEGEYGPEVTVNAYLRKRGFPDLGVHDAEFSKIYIRLSDEEGDLEALHDDLKAKNVKVTSEISVKPWGLKDFTIMDLDKNLLNFSQAIKVL